MPPAAYPAQSNTEYSNYRNVLEQNNAPLPVSYAPNFQAYGIQHQPHQQQQQQQYSNPNIYHHHQQSPTSTINNNYSTLAHTVNPYSNVPYRDVTPTYYKYSYADDMHSLSSGSDNGVYITQI